MSCPCIYQNAKREPPFSLLGLSNSYSKSQSLSRGTLLNRHNTTKRTNQIVTFHKANVLRGAKRLGAGDASRYLSNRRLLGTSDIGFFLRGIGGSYEILVRCIALPVCTRNVVIVMAWNEAP